MKQFSMVSYMNALLVALMAALLAQPMSAQSADDHSSFVAVGAAPAPASAVSAKSVKKIQMVSSTLKDILQSVVNEEKTETELYNKYKTWCDNEVTGLGKNLANMKTDLANAKVQSEEQTSTIDSLKLFIKKSEKETEETKDAIAQAVAIRKEENDEYTEEMTTNQQSLRQIEAAIKHVGKVQKQGGFLQNGVMKRLQINQPGESSYVYGVMKGLKDQLTKARANLKKVEEEKVAGHNTFMDTKGKSLKALMDTTTEKKIQLTELVGKQEQTKRKIQKLTEEVEKLAKQLADTQATCQNANQEWALRQADRTKEKAALNEAIRYLTEMSLEQISLLQKRNEENNDEDQSSVVFAPSFLQDSAVANKLSENAFYAAASAELLGEDDEIDAHLKKDTFNGVKGVVNKLITAHEDNQKAETKKKDYCKKEIEAKEDEKADTTNALEFVKAQIGKKTAEVETLADEIKKMYESIDTAKKNLDEAGKLRKEEKTQFESASKDRALAIKVLNQAKQVLQDFYDKKKAFLQGYGAAAPAAAYSSQPPPAKFSSSDGRKTTASFGAVAMVQDIADDIAKEQKDSLMEENQKAADYEKLQKNTFEKTDETHKDITERTMAKAKLGVQINSLKETETEKTDDLASVNRQLTSLHSQCDELLKNHEKRKKARTFEINQLKDVVDILSGSSVAVRTGLMQDSDLAGDDAGADEGNAAE